MATQQPQSLAQAVEWLLSTLPPDELDSLRMAPPEDLIMLHFGLGNFVREQLGLWTTNHALRKETGHTHPDDVSLAIIEALWQRLQEKPDPAT